MLWTIHALQILTMSRCLSRAIHHVPLRCDSQLPSRRVSGGRVNGPRWFVPCSFLSSALTLTSIQATTSYDR